MKQTEQFERAVSYATRIHALQKRKGSEIPYVSHILAVAGIAIEYGASEEEAIAALLHDAVEDAGGKPRLEDITLKFGENVARIVTGCTDAIDRKQLSSRERQALYIEHIKTADESVRLVAASDKLHNARSTIKDLRKEGQAVWNRFNVGKEDSIKFYKDIVSAMKERPSERLNSLFDELANTVQLLEELSGVQSGEKVGAPWSMELYLKALNFAGAAHREQKVPGKECNYVVHLASASAEVISALAVSRVEKPDLAIQCAILHDTIEDPKIPYSQIESLFGKEVADGVLALSKNQELPKEQQLLDSIERIKQMAAEVGMVKLADRITNLQPPPSYWSKEKIREYRDEASLILEHLGYTNNHLAKRLQEKAKAYESYL